MKILVIDENNILFRMLNIHQGLLFNHKRTGGLYGFVTLLTKYVNIHKPNRVVVCTDSPPLIRKQEYTNYKANRKKLDDDFFTYSIESRKYVQEFLQDSGIIRWGVKGYEADDLIAAICGRYWDHEIVICSNDDDLFQVLTSSTTIQRNKGTYTQQDFQNEYGINPIEWTIVRAMCGNHNNIPPIYKGLGVKTALKIVKDKDKWKEFSSKYTDELFKNLALVTLPHKSFKREWIPDIEKKESIDERDLDNILTKRFGIQVTNQMYEAFVS